MSDNLSINPSELYYAIKDIELSIDEIENVNKTINSLVNLGIDVTDYNIRVKTILDNLEKLYSKLSRIKNKYVECDKSIASLYEYLDNGGNDNDDNYGSINDINLDEGNNVSNEQQLDDVKGNNKNLGGKLTNDAFSIMRGRL